MCWEPFHITIWRTASFLEEGALNLRTGLPRDQDEPSEEIPLGIRYLNVGIDLKGDVSFWGVGVVVDDICQNQWEERWKRQRKRSA